MFEGNQRVLSLIGGGLIPKSQYNTERNSLFSSLDWTPTLLYFAGIYDEISKEDQSWDGIVQYDMIMNDDDYMRDHIVLNVGLQNLESAAVIFEWPKDGNLYKYIALNSDIDVLHRENGWSQIDEENKQIIFISDDVSKNSDIKNAQALNNKYLFNLVDDIAERENLLITKDQNVNDLVDYAKNLFSDYVQHPLYSENIAGLWNYLEEEDMTEQGVLFNDPWMSEDEYFDYVTLCINKQRHHSPIPDALLDLYTQKWKAPKYENDKKTKKKHGKNDKKLSSLHPLLTLIDSSMENVHFELYFIAVPVVLTVLIIYAAVNKCIVNKNGGKKYAAVSSYGSV